MASFGRVAPITAVLMHAAVIGPPVALAAEQVSYEGRNVTGVVSYVRTVNLRQQSPVTSRSMLAPAAEVLRPVPPRLTPSGGSLAVTPTTAPKGPQKADALDPRYALRSVAPFGVASISTSFGFNALSHLDQRLSYGGNQFSIEPPNASVAVGNGYVLEGVNNAVQVYTLQGAPVLPATLASNQVFGLPPAINRATMVFGVSPTDMRVYFDQGMNRWLIIQRAQDNDAAGNYLSSSHLYLAVSQTPDPAAGYNIYVMDTTNATHFGCPCIADYPQIGSDQHGFYIAWNQFNYDPGSGYYRFVNASVLALSKVSLAAGSASPTAVQFFLPYGSGFEFSLQPATTPPGASNFLANGGVEYFVSTVQGSANQVALWAMYNTTSLGSASPSLGFIRIAVSSLPYYLPNAGRQRDGPRPYGSALVPPEPLERLDGGDVRVQAVSYASGRLYVTFGSGVLDDHGQFVVGGVYTVLSPTYRSGVLAARVLRQGYLYVNGNDILRPAIAVNAQGNGAIAVTLTGPEWYPTAACIPFNSTTGPSPIQIAAMGSQPEDGFTGYSGGGGFGVARWGDYNTAVAAADGSIWMVAQYVGSYPRTEFANWNTFVFQTQP